MIPEILPLLKELQGFGPIHDFKFGHTRTQLEYFTTANQQGNEKFAYWQHVLQLRALYLSLTEMQIKILESDEALRSKRKWWRFENKNQYNIRRYKLLLQRNQLSMSINEKKLEAEQHVDIINTRYQHLLELDESAILDEDQEYWAARLGRQLAVSHLARVLGIGEGEMSAVMSLPQEQRMLAIDAMREVVSDAAPLLQPQPEPEKLSEWI